MDIYFRGKHNGKEMDLRLHGGERQWQLEKKVKRSNGSGESWEPFRFYSSLPCALQSVADAQFRISSSVEKALERLDHLAEAAESAIATRLSAAMNQAKELEGSNRCSER